jgi:transcriptional regulator with XRE-family HTH domain
MKESISMDAKKIVQDYLKEAGLTQRELAHRCRLTPEGLCRALSKNTVSAQVAYKLHHYTQGKLLYETLTEEPFPKKKKRGV